MSTKSAKHTLFTNRLREAIARSGMKKKAIAQSIGISQNTLSRYLIGDRGPHESIVRLLAQTLGVTVEYLLGNTGNSNSELQLAEPPVAAAGPLVYLPDAVALTGLDAEDRATVLRLLAALRSGQADIRRHLIGQLKIIETAIEARQQQPREKEDHAS